jgi:hypothetical protein
MASRMVAPETPAPALSASSSANSWEVVASDDDDGADVEGRLGGEEDDTPPHESDTRERRTERTPSGSSDSSAGSAGASAAMRRLRQAMVAEGTREEERTTSTPKKKKKREPARARLERLRVRSSARRYRDLGLCERECAALAIATELVFSESSRGIASRTLDGVFSPRTVDAESAGSATCANDEPKETPKKKKKKPPPMFSMFSFSACFLLRRATRFETFAAFAQLGKRLRESIASGSASSETCASAIENVESQTRKRRESFAPNRRSRKNGAGSPRGFRTERRLAGFRNRERVSVLRGVLAFAVVAALALAAAARAGVGRSTWRVATSATAAAAAAAARSAARVPPRLP